MGEDELVAGAGHRDVAEATFLGQVERARLSVDERPATQRVGKRQRVPARHRREDALGQAGQEDQAELESFRLVHREHLHCILVRVGWGGRAVVAGTGQGAQVAHEEGQPIVGEVRGLAAHQLEEPGDRGEGLLGPFVATGRQLTKPAATAQERVQDLACGALLGHLAVGADVLAQARHSSGGLGREADDPGLVLMLDEHVP